MEGFENFSKSSATVPPVSREIEYSDTSYRPFHPHDATISSVDAQGNGSTRIDSEGILKTGVHGNDTRKDHKFQDPTPVVNATFNFDSVYADVQGVNDLVDPLNDDRMREKRKDNDRLLFEATKDQNSNTRSTFAPPLLHASDAKTPLNVSSSSQTWNSFMAITEVLFNSAGALPHATSDSVTEMQRQDSQTHLSSSVPLKVSNAYSSVIHGNATENENLSDPVHQISSSRMAVPLHNRILTNAEPVGNGTIQPSPKNETFIATLSTKERKAQLAQTSTNALVSTLSISSQLVTSEVVPCEKSIPKKGRQCTAMYTPSLSNVNPNAQRKLLQKRPQGIPLFQSTSPRHFFTPGFPTSTGQTTRGAQSHQIINVFSRNISSTMTSNHAINHSSTTRKHRSENIIPTLSDLEIMANREFLMQLEESADVYRRLSKGEIREKSNLSTAVHSKPFLSSVVSSRTSNPALPPRTPSKRKQVSTAATTPAKPILTDHTVTAALNDLGQDPIIIGSRRDGNDILTVFPDSSAKCPPLIGELYIPSSAKTDVAAYERSRRQLDACFRQSLAQQINIPSKADNPSTPSADPGTAINSTPKKTIPQGTSTVPTTKTNTSEPIKAPPDVICVLSTLPDKSLSLQNVSGVTSLVDPRRSLALLDPSSSCAHSQLFTQEKIPDVDRNLQAQNHQTTQLVYAVGNSVVAVPLESYSSKIYTPSQLYNTLGSQFRGQNVYTDHCGPVSAVGTCNTSKSIASAQCCGDLPLQLDLEMNGQLTEEWCFRYETLLHEGDSQRRENTPIQTISRKRSTGKLVRSKSFTNKSTSLHQGVDTSRTSTLRRSSSTYSMFEQFRASDTPSAITASLDNPLACPSILTLPFPSYLPHIRVWDATTKGLVHPPLLLLPPMETFLLQLSGLQTSLQTESNSDFVNTISFLSTDGAGIEEDDSIETETLDSAQDSFYSTRRSKIWLTESPSTMELVFGGRDAYMNPFYFSNATALQTAFSACGNYLAAVIVVNAEAVLKKLSPHCQSTKCTDILDEGTMQGANAQGTPEQQINSEMSRTLPMERTTFESDAILTNSYHIAIYDLRSKDHGETSDARPWSRYSDARYPSIFVSIPDVLAGDLGYVLAPGENASPVSVTSGIDAGSFVIAVGNVEHLLSLSADIKQQPKKNLSAREFFGQHVSLLTLADPNRLDCYAPPSAKQSYYNMDHHETVLNANDVVQHVQLRYSPYSVRHSVSILTANGLLSLISPTLGSFPIASGQQSVDSQQNWGYITKDKRMGTFIRTRQSSTSFEKELLLFIEDSKCPRSSEQLSIPFLSVDSYANTSTSSEGVASIVPSVISVSKLSISKDDTRNILIIALSNGRIVFVLHDPSVSLQILGIAQTIGHPIAFTATVSNKFTSIMATSSTDGIKDVEIVIAYLGYQIPQLPSIFPNQPNKHLAPILALNRFSVRFSKQLIRAFLGRTPAKSPAESPISPVGNPYSPVMELSAEDLLEFAPCAPVTSMCGHPYLPLSLIGCADGSLYLMEHAPEAGHLLIGASHVHALLSALNIGGQFTTSRQNARRQHLLQTTGNSNDENGQKNLILSYGIKCSCPLKSQCKCTQAAAELSADTTLSPESQYTVTSISFAEDGVTLMVAFSISNEPVSFLPDHIADVYRPNAVQELESDITEGLNFGESVQDSLASEIVTMRTKEVLAKSPIPTSRLLSVREVAASSAIATSKANSNTSTRTAKTRMTASVASSSSAPTNKQILGNSKKENSMNGTENTENGARSCSGVITLLLRLPKTWINSKYRQFGVHPQEGLYVNFEDGDVPVIVDGLADDYPLVQAVVQYQHTLQLYDAVTFHRCNGRLNQSVHAPNAELTHDDPGAKTTINGKTGPDTPSSGQAANSDRIAHSRRTTVSNGLGTTKGPSTAANEPMSLRQLYGLSLSTIPYPPHELIGPLLEFSPLSMCIGHNIVGNGDTRTFLNSPTSPHNVGNSKKSNQTPWSPISSLFSSRSKNSTIPPPMLLRLPCLLPLHVQYMTPVTAPKTTTPTSIANYSSFGTASTSRAQYADQSKTTSVRHLNTTTTAPNRLQWTVQGTVSNPDSVVTTTTFAPSRSIQWPGFAPVKRESEYLQVTRPMTTEKLPQGVAPNGSTSARSVSSQAASKNALEPLRRYSVSTESSRHSPVIASVHPSDLLLTAAVGISSGNVFIHTIDITQPYLLFPLVTGTVFRWESLDEIKTSSGMKGSALDHESAGQAFLSALLGTKPTDDVAQTTTKSLRRAEASTRALVRNSQSTTEKLITLEHSKSPTAELGTGACTSSSVTSNDAESQTMLHAVLEPTLLSVPQDALYRKRKHIRLQRMVDPAQLQHILGDEYNKLYPLPVPLSIDWAFESAYIRICTNQWTIQAYDIVKGNVLPPSAIKDTAFTSSSQSVLGWQCTGIQRKVQSFLHPHKYGMALKKQKQLAQENTLNTTPTNNVSTASMSTMVTSGIHSSPLRHSRNVSLPLDPARPRRATKRRASILNTLHPESTPSTRKYIPNYSLHHPPISPNEPQRWLTLTACTAAYFPISMPLCSCSACGGGDLGPCKSRKALNGVNQEESEVPLMVVGDVSGTLRLYNHPPDYPGLAARSYLPHKSSLLISSTIFTDTPDEKVLKTMQASLTACHMSTTKRKKLNADPLGFPGAELFLASTSRQTPSNVVNTHFDPTTLTVVSAGGMNALLCASILGSNDTRLFVPQSGSAQAKATQPQNVNGLSSIRSRNMDGAATASRHNSISKPVVSPTTKTRNLNQSAYRHNVEIGDMDSPPLSTSFAIIEGSESVEPLSAAVLQRETTKMYSNGCFLATWALIPPKRLPTTIAQSLQRYAASLESNISILEDRELEELSTAEISIDQDDADSTGLLGSLPAFEDPSLADVDRIQNLASTDHTSVYSPISGKEIIHPSSFSSPLTPTLSPGEPLVSSGDHRSSAPPKSPEPTGTSMESPVPSTSEVAFHSLSLPVEDPSSLRPLPLLLTSSHPHEEAALISSMSRNSVHTSASSPLSAFDHPLLFSNMPGRMLDAGVIIQGVDSVPPSESVSAPSSKEGKPGTIAAFPVNLSAPSVLRPVTSPVEPLLHYPSEYALYSETDQMDETDAYLSSLDSPPEKTKSLQAFRESTGTPWGCTEVVEPASPLSPVAQELPVPSIQISAKSHASAPRLAPHQRSSMLPTWLFHTNATVPPQPSVLSSHSPVGAFDSRPSIEAIPEEGSSISQHVVDAARIPLPTPSPNESPIYSPAESPEVENFVEMPLSVYDIRIKEDIQENLTQNADMSHGTAEASKSPQIRKEDLQLAIQETSPQTMVRRAIMSASPEFRPSIAKRALYFAMSPLMTAQSPTYPSFRPIRREGSSNKTTVIPLSAQYETQEEAALEAADSSNSPPLFSLDSPAQRLNTQSDVTSLPPHRIFPTPYEFMVPIETASKPMDALSTTAVTSTEQGPSLESNGEQPMQTLSGPDLTVAVENRLEHRTVVSVLRKSEPVVHSLPTTKIMEPPSSRTRTTNPMKTDNVKSPTALPVRGRPLRFAPQKVKRASQSLSMREPLMVLAVLKIQGEPSVGAQVQEVSPREVDKNAGEIILIPDDHTNDAKDEDALCDRIDSGSTNQGIALSQKQTPDAASVPSQRPRAPPPRPPTNNPIMQQIRNRVPPPPPLGQRQTIDAPTLRSSSLTHVAQSPITRNTFGSPSSGAHTTSPKGNEPDVLESPSSTASSDSSYSLLPLQPPTLPDFRRPLTLMTSAPFLMSDSESED